MPPFTLIAPPGLSDLPDSALDAEEIAQGQHAVKILENTKFGVVRPEFFYMGRFSDGQTVARPTSKVDNLPYLVSEVIYLWEIVLSADPRDGIPSGPGTLLYFDYDVEQQIDNDPGLVHCKTVYHVQGGQTTETRDGELSIWAVGVRGLDQLDLGAVPAWTNVPDADLDLDSAWREDRLKNLNAAAKRSVVQAEFFDLGEFGNGQTVPRPTSDVDGFQYPYADLVFLTSWRWPSAFAGGTTSGPSGHTLVRIEKGVNGATGLVDTTVTYRWGASSDTVTQDGRVRVFAFGFRAGITATGTVSFTDLNANVFLPGKPPLDDDTLVMVRNSKFAALRPEFFVTNQGHGSTVPLPTSPIDGYAYARAELIYLYERSDTAAPGSIGSLIGLHGFVRQDTGAVTLNTFYYRQGGAQTNTNNGTFRVVTVALRGKQVEVDSDPNEGGGNEPGFEGNVDNDLITSGGIVLMRNANFESGDGQWVKGSGFTIIEDPTHPYDGGWVAKFVGTGAATLENSVPIPISPGDVLRASCFIKRLSGNGLPRVQISWRDINKNEIGTANGYVVQTSTYTISRIIGTAPAGTYFAVVGCTSGAPTVSQTSYYDQFNVTFFPIDLNEVAESTERKHLLAIAREQLLRRAGTHGQQLLFNPGFEDGTSFWRLSSGVTIVTNATNAHSGNKYLQISASGSRENSHADEAGTSKFFEVNEGDIIEFGGWIYRQSGDGEGHYYVRITDKDKLNPSFVESTHITAAAWTRSPATTTIAAGKKYVELAYKLLNPTVTTVLRFDDTFLQIIRPASLVQYASGAAVEDREPAEAGANVTETRTAAAISGQGALATLSEVGDGEVVGTRKLIDSAYADTQRRPTKLRRAAADLAADDIIKTAEESRLNALSLQNAPAEAGAEVTTGKSLTLLINRTLANIADTASRFAAIEALADRTGIHTAAAIASQGALATLSAAAWASQVSGRPTELTDGRVGSGLTPAGEPPGAKLVKGYAGAVALANEIAGTIIGRTSAGWYSVGTIDFAVPSDISTLTVTVNVWNTNKADPSDTRNDRYTGGDNVGIALADVPPGTPTDTRTNAGAITMSPSGAVKGTVTKLRCYVRIQLPGGTGTNSVDGTLAVSRATPASSVAVA